MPTAGLIKKAYTRPAVFNKTFDKGEKLSRAMMDPGQGDGVLPNSLGNLKKFSSVEDKHAIPDQEIPKKIALPALRFGWDLKHKWRLTKWTVNNGQSTVSETAFDDESRTMISLTANNFPLQKIVDGEKDKIVPYHSELWSETYEADIKAGNVNYIMINNVANSDTKASWQRRDDFSIRKRKTRMLLSSTWIAKTLHRKSLSLHGRDRTMEVVPPF